MLRRDARDFRRLHPQLKAVEQPANALAELYSECCRSFRQNISVSCFFFAFLTLHLRNPNFPLDSPADLPVQALKPWLGHLALLETSGSGFRFRICGTELIPRCGGEATGRGLDELPPEVGASIADILGCAKERSAPVIAALILPHEDGTQLYSELVLPLRDRDLPALLLLGSYSILR